jgi:hypothetical protein
MSYVAPKVVTVARQRFELRREQVERTMRYVLPEPIASHYVVIDNRRYPPKQVVGVLTGIDRADFTTHQARRILTGLGFAAGRQPRHELPERAGAYAAHANAVVGAMAPAAQAAGRSSRPDAAELEPFVGQWVATRGVRVLVAAPDPRSVVSWLAEHREQADSMFRVPGTEFQAGGLAPL